MVWVEWNTIPESRDNTIQREGEREGERHLTILLTMKDADWTREF